MSVDWSEFDRNNKLDLPNYIGGRSMYYDKDVKPIGLWTWCRLNEDRSYSQIGDTHMLGYRVSTIWLGIDHGWFSEEPILFETMIFTPLWIQSELFPWQSFRQSMDFQWRYATEVQAYAGHWLATELLRAELSNRAINGRRAPRMLE